MSPSHDRQPLLPSSSIHTHSRLSRPPTSFPSSSTSAFATTPDAAEEGSEASTERSTLIGSSAPGKVGQARRWSTEQRVEERRQGVPKLSRECFWSEVKCYGSYILPVLLVFGVLVVGASLIGVGIKKGWFR